MKRILFLVLTVISAAGSSEAVDGSSSQAARDLSLPTVQLRDAPSLKFPGKTDSNSPAHWDGDTLYLFYSVGSPVRSSGPDLFHLSQPLAATYNNEVNGGRWIECTWKADDGTLYGWYHNEPHGLCPGTTLTEPRIGAVRSKDNGATFHDLGVVLQARPNMLCCEAKNGSFAGGHGDFSIMLDSDKAFVYFFFGNYAGEVSEQGVCVARMRYADRNAPVGKVTKWHKGKWEEPGVGGRVTPVFPAAIDWARADADAFWGPAIHWNTHLNRYVILLNRTKEKPGWPQEGIYVTFNSELDNPTGWTPPKKIHDKGNWYPEVIGTDAKKHETDKLAGRAGRFFMGGESRWEILFLNPGEKP